MDPSPVDRVFEDFKSAIEVLRKTGDVSLQNSIDELFRKALLLSAASWFEHLIVEGIVEVTSEVSNQSSAIVSFVRNKGVARQYHTFFNWESSNATQFFGLFGPEFTKYMRERIDTDPSLSDSITAFLELGHDRNRMVHGNYAAFVLEKTTTEIYSLYRKATPFAEGFAAQLKAFCKSEARSPVPA